ncbi:MAG: T9SS type A sorting domain-containing protein, partial [Bacteroidota bacterium]
LEIPDGLVAEKLLIYSDLGEIVLMEKIESKSSLFIIDNQNIASGVYVLEIMTNLGNIKKMLVIQR